METAMNNTQTADGKLRWLWLSVLVIALDLGTKALATAPFRLLRSYVNGDNFTTRRDLFNALSEHNAPRHLNL